MATSQVSDSTSHAAPELPPRLHVITDTRGGRDPLPDVRGAAAAARMCDARIAVQVRAKQASDRELFDLVRRVVDVARLEGHPASWVVVNDRVDIALAAGADGVHIGADDLPLSVVRGLGGPSLAVGGTARDREAAEAAAAAGATYVGVGPCFATSTKDGLPDPLGLPGLEAVTRSASLPVIAIGGIGPEEAAAAVRAGAYGIAVVSAVSQAADPRVATVALLRAVGAGR